jgi:hypothetical protein
VGASSEPKVWPRPALRAPAMALTAALAILVALATCATALDSDHGKQQHQRPTRKPSRWTAPSARREKTP